MPLTGLARIVLELAHDGVVLEEPDSTAVAATYRELAHAELVHAAWWYTGVLPLEVSIVAQGRRALRADRLADPFRHTR